MKGEWDCEICRGFGVYGDSREDSKLCPKCLEKSDSDDDDPEPCGQAMAKPFSVWHIHGPVDDPVRAVSKGCDHCDHERAIVVAIDEAKRETSGRMVVFTRQGQPILTLPCPLPRKVLARNAA